MIVPVFMSSLFQVPFALQIVGRDDLVGIVCGTRRNLKPSTSCLRINPDSNIVVAGAMDDYVARSSTICGTPCRPEVPTADYDRAEADFVALVPGLQEPDPSMSALVFECTGFQPFARAVQREMGLPVFSWSTLLDFAYTVVVHRDFYGHV